ncbi:MAG: adenylate/guanylate cyclase domain-containing protein [Verrucomicrobiota bacterium]
MNIRSKIRLLHVVPVLVGLMGALLYWTPLGKGLRDISYDLPYMFSQHPVPEEVVIVYLDEQSQRDLGQDLNAPWDRALHVQLLNRLKDAGAELVFFDILFADAWGEPEVDRDFAEAIRRNGSVILGGEIVVRQQTGSPLLTESLILPLEELEEAALGWGLVSIAPFGTTVTVRRLWTGSVDWPTATWKMAEQRTDPGERRDKRWLFYYGPAGTVPSISYARAIDPEAVPKGFFQGKAVLVGSRPNTGFMETGKDEFSGPYTRFTELSYPGVEIHATAFLNLIRDDWVKRPADGWMVVLFLLGGGGAAYALFRFRPAAAVLVSVAMVVGFTLVGFFLLIEGRVWVDWAILVVAQVPLGLAGSIVNQYWKEFRQREQLRKAFSAYVSPHLADQLVEQKFSLAPGGEVVPCTILFSDLENFTNLSETLSPNELSDLLIGYFNLTTRAIQEEEGTVVKFIGDAVLAVWGAPLPDEAQADRAVKAGGQIARDGTLRVGQMQCRTRVGLHSGKVLAGNLGSDQRFDYTVIGDAVNLASRLEGMNKMLGTSVLLSDETLALVEGDFPVRSMGRFRVKGKQTPVEVYELVEADRMADVKTFTSALAAFQSGDWLEAQNLFQKVNETRTGGDPPSEYFIQYMAGDYYGIAPEDWEGVINLKDK